MSECFISFEAYIYISLSYPQSFIILTPQETGRRQKHMENESLARIIQKGSGRADCEMKGYNYEAFVLSGISFCATPMRRKLLFLFSLIPSLQTAPKLKLTLFLAPSFDGSLSLVSECWAFLSAFILKSWCNPIPSSAVTTACFWALSLGASLDSHLHPTLCRKDSADHAKRAQSPSSKDFVSSYFCLRFHS